MFGSRTDRTIQFKWSWFRFPPVVPLDQEEMILILLNNGNSSRLDESVKDIKVFIEKQNSTFHLLKFNFQ